METKEKIAPLPTLGNRDTVRTHSKRGRETYNIPFEKLRVRKGFNVRQDYGDIPELAMSLLNDGQHTPLSGDMGTDGLYYITAGHRRYKAFEWLKKNGHPVDTVEGFINAKGTTEEDRIVSMFTENNQKPLEPVEAAICFQRLINLKWTPEQIAERVGRSVFYVNDMLILAKQPKEIQNAVQDHDITATSVIKADKKKIPKETVTKMIRDKKERGQRVKNADIVKEARKAKPELFDGVTYDQVEKVILAWSGWAKHEKSELKELYKEMKSLFRK